MVKLKPYYWFSLVLDPNTEKLPWFLQQGKEYLLAHSVETVLLLRCTNLKTYAFRGALYCNFVGAVCHVRGFRYVFQKISMNYFQNVTHMAKFTN